MLDNLPILSLIAFSPLLGVILLLFMPKDSGRQIKAIGILATLIPLILSVFLFAQFDPHSGQPQYTEDTEWIHIPLNKEGPALHQLTSYYFQLKYKMAVDGLSLMLVFLTALVATMAALASVHIKKRWKTFYILFLLLETGMLGVFMARDLLLFFMFFETTLVPMYFLIGIWGYRDRERAANKFLIYNGIGSALMLIAFLILVSTAGFTLQQPDANTAHAFYTSDLDQIAHNLTDPKSYSNFGPEFAQGIPNPLNISDTLKWSMFIMLLVAFGIKLPIFPFHTWMLKVHTEAPPSIVMIHSGILLKMGAYGLLRFGISLFPDLAKQWAAMLAVLGIINIIYGAVLAYRQQEFKLVLAYSSISHMGIVLLGIAAFNQIGYEGAIFQMISHGLISALMFLMVGSMYERTGTTELDRLGGLAKSVPFMSGILLVAGMASLGLPGLSGFISELLAFIGLFQKMPVITAVGTLGIILAAVYVLRGVLKITFGPMPEAYLHLKDARLIEAVAMVSLTGFILLIGIYPAILSTPIQSTVDMMIQNIAMKIGG
ncbi:complex I subunit 4 family protein [Ferviditalea candida]|uniref:NADH-quinone oxidoreductase subunit M n=1 Tax=Ferviditalea candida TaxID=3108399 RepID=A0ABU5ZJ26_9BACL|nr:NADH-quinone oxidoreductase subunit M [Paenibacillaceae bacterium T2]